MGSNSSMLLVEHMFQTKGCIPSVVDKQPQGHHLPQQKVVGPKIIFFANEVILSEKFLRGVRRGTKIVRLIIN